MDEEKKWIVSEEDMKHAIYDHRPPGSPPWPRSIYPRDHAVACAQIQHLIDKGWLPPDDDIGWAGARHHPELGGSMDSTLRDKLATTIQDAWNNPATTKDTFGEFLFHAADNVLALILQKVEQVDNPYPDPYKNTAIEECQRVAFEQCRQAVLRALGRVEDDIRPACY